MIQVAALVAAMALGLVAGPAWAQGTIRYASFGNVSAFSFAGNAAQGALNGSPVLQLVPGAAYTSGAAYLSVPITLGASGAFKTIFQFQVVGPASGTEWSDGFTFVLAASPAGLGGAANNGMGVGYQGVPNSVAVEFNTFLNPGIDPSANDVAVLADGDINVEDAPTESWGEPYRQGGCGADGPGAAGCLTDGQVWTVQIGYDGTVMTVIVQDGPNAKWAVVSKYPVNLLAQLGGTTAYVGFSAASGGGGICELQYPELDDGVLKAGPLMLSLGAAMCWDEIIVAAYGCRADTTSFFERPRDDITFRRAAQRTPL